MPDTNNVQILEKKDRCSYQSFRHLRLAGLLKKLQVWKRHEREDGGERKEKREGGER
jgi:hypothetical protein